MINKINYTSCPVCGSSSVSKIIRAKDHTVSGESFDIFHCANCQLRFTQDAPAEDSIDRYYQSENYISHTNTSKGLVNRIYQVVRRRSNRQKRKLVEKFTNTKNGILLDVGSGTGFFVAEMKSAGWKVKGLEPDTGAREIAEKINGVQLFSSDDLFKQSANLFDAITLWHVLEHVHDLKNYIQRFKALLKNNGRLFVAVPNYISFDAQVYKEYWAAYDVPRHLYHFTPYTMKHLMAGAGLKIIDIKPMWFDSFYVSLLSSKYKNARPDDPVGRGKPNWLAAVWTGIRSNLNAFGDIKKCSSLIYVISK